MRGTLNDDVRPYAFLSQVVSSPMPTSKSSICLPGSHGLLQAEEEVLSAIIRELNDRFGTEFSEEDKAFIEEA